MMRGGEEEVSVEALTAQTAGAMPSPQCIGGLCVPIGPWIGRLLVCVCEREGRLTSFAWRLHVPDRLRELG